MNISQVLDDGSVVHINKTTISDTDEDGNRSVVEDEDKRQISNRTIMITIVRLTST